jgi:hypothetical protein
MAAAADGDADPVFAGERDHLGDVFRAVAADHRLRPWLAQPGDEGHSRVLVCGGASQRELT